MDKFPCCAFNRFAAVRNCIVMQKWKSKHNHSNNY